MINGVKEFPGFQNIDGFVNEKPKFSVSQKPFSIDTKLPSDGFNWSHVYDWDPILLSQNKDVDTMNSILNEFVTCHFSAADQYLIKNQLVFRLLQVLQIVVSYIINSQLEVQKLYGESINENTLLRVANSRYKMKNERLMIALRNMREVEKCPICGTYFDSDISLDKHINKVHHDVFVLWTHVKKNKKFDAQEKVEKLRKQIDTLRILIKAKSFTKKENVEQAEEFSNIELPEEKAPAPVFLPNYSPFQKAVHDDDGPYLVFENPSEVISIEPSSSTDKKHENAVKYLEASPIRKIESNEKISAKLQINVHDQAHQVKMSYMEKGPKWRFRKKVQKSMKKIVPDAPKSSIAQLFENLNFYTDEKLEEIAWTKKEKEEEESEPEKEEEEEEEDIYLTSSCYSSLQYSSERAQYYSESGGGTNIFEKKIPSLYNPGGRRFPTSERHKIRRKARKEVEKELSKRRKEELARIKEEAMKQAKNELQKMPPPTKPTYKSNEKPKGTSNQKQPGEKDKRRKDDLDDIFQSISSIFDTEKSDHNNDENKSQNKENKNKGNKKQKSMPSLNFSDDELKNVDSLKRSKSTPGKTPLNQEELNKTQKEKDEIKPDKKKKLYDDIDSFDMPSFDNDLPQLPHSDIETPKKKNAFGSKYKTTQSIPKQKNQSMSPDSPQNISHKTENSQNVKEQSDGSNEKVESNETIHQVPPKIQFEAKNKLSPKQRKIQQKAREMQELKELQEAQEKWDRDHQSQTKVDGDKQELAESFSKQAPKQKLKVQKEKLKQDKESDQKRPTSKSKTIIQKDEQEWAESSSRKTPVSKKKQKVEEDQEWAESSSRKTPVSKKKQKLQDEDQEWAESSSKKTPVSKKKQKVEEDQEWAESSSKRIKKKKQKPNKDELDNSSKKRNVKQPQELVRSDESERSSIFSSSSSLQKNKNTPQTILKTKNSESTKQTKPNRVVIQHPDITPSKGKENDIQENSIPLSSIKGSSSLSKLNESELKFLMEMT